MANERLISAIQGIRSTKANTSKPDISAYRIPDSEIELQPLDSIKADLSSELDTTTLAERPPMLSKTGPKTGFSVEDFKQPLPGIDIPKQQEFSLVVDPEFNWNDIQDRRLILDAQLEAESRYNPNAGSHKGAQGIAQFMPGTWADYQKKGYVPKDKTPYDIGAALQGQRKYMERMFGRDFINQHPDSLTQIKMALAGYNAGPQSVINAFNKAKELSEPDKWMEYLPRKEETIPYVQRILDTARSHKTKNYDPKFDWGYKKQGGILRTTKS